MVQSDELRFFAFKKDSIKRTVLFFLFCIQLSVLQAQYPRYSIQNFSRAEYGKNQSSDNWCITQGKNGLIYAGNASGVMEYDGKDWKFIPVKPGAYVLSLAVDSAGMIFVGTQNDFGYLAPDKYGRLGYHSLCGSLSEDDRFFSNIIKTFVCNDAVYFQSEEKIFIYRGGKLEIVNSETSFHTSFAVNDQVYVRQREKGLMLLSGKTLKTVDPGNNFLNKGIFAMLPLDSGKILIATREDGIWLYDHRIKDAPVYKMTIEDEDRFNAAGIYGGVRLQDDKLAFNTIGSGVLITGLDGKILSVINSSVGLRVNDVKAVFEDDQNNLWLALNNGISKVGYGLAVSHYGEESGVQGNVNAVCAYHGQLYIATSNGVFTRNESGPVTFRQVAGVTGQIWSLNVIRDELIAGGTEGIYKIENNSAKQKTAANSYALCYVPSRDLIISGDQDIKVIDKNWKVIKTYPDLNNIVKILQDPVGDGSTTSLWVCTRNSGTLRLDLSADMNFSETFIDLPKEIEGESVLPFYLDKKIVFGSSGGLLEMDGKNADWLPTYKGLNLAEPVSLIKDDKNIAWISLNNQPVQINKQTGSIVSEPFLAIDAGRINDIYYEPSGLTWIAADDGLLCYDPSRKRQSGEVFRTLIRRVSVKDSVLFFGHSSSEHPTILPRLTYDLNRVTVEFASPYFHRSSQLLYSYRLTGLDTSWSSWSHETSATLSNLAEGNYTFMVRAANIYGKESDAVSFEFVILPPWYRTLMAYVVYVLLFCLFLYLFAKMNSMRLRRKNLELEKIIAVRTNEIREKNKELEMNNHVIQEQKREITDSINYAKGIQQAVLPAINALQKNLPESFILYKPKDIVSGDFYFVYESELNSEKYIVFAAADCTGHGVPGAMVSLICNNALNRSVKEFSLVDPGLILDRVTDLVLETFEKSVSTIKDGMDISLCVLYPEKGILKWAGANNPLWIIRANGELEEIKPNKQPVGYAEKRAPFTTHSIELLPHDNIYLFTDGYVDQFGGGQGKKFKSLNLKNLLLSIHSDPAKEQQQKLENAFNSWKGALEQIDDVSLIGVRYIT